MFSPRTLSLGQLYIALHYVWVQVSALSLPPSQEMCQKYSRLDIESSETPPV